VSELKDLNDLLQNSGPHGRRYTWKARHMLEDDIDLAERMLEIASVSAPTYVTDALCKWVQECGGPK
jgi:hypothetical protein